MLDEKLVQETLAAIEKRKKEIANLEKPDWKTNLSFAYDADFANANRVNIQVETNLTKLVKILSFLKSQRDTFDAIVKEMGLDLRFKWGNYFYEDWSYDIKTRIDIINIKQMRDQLAAWESIVAGLESEEVKKAKQLADVMKQMGLK